MTRLGVVSFLNSRPLVEGLGARPDVSLRFEVPSRLAGLLDAGTVDVALLPVFDVFSSGGRYEVISDACIGCDGETMTVRVFSQIPPDRIERIHADTDSHTSVNLARVLWRAVYGRVVEIVPLDARSGYDRCDAVLLIGDKVVDPHRAGFAYEVDLGGAWRQHTGLPFIFAVWAARRPETPEARRRMAELGELLSAARDAGVARAEEIATTLGPGLGWPVELARRYLARSLRFRIDGRFVEGAELFARRCAEMGLAPRGAGIHWPESLRPAAVVG